MLAAASVSISSDASRRMPGIRGGRGVTWSSSSSDMDGGPGDDAVLLPVVGVPASSAALWRGVGGGWGVRLFNQSNFGSMAWPKGRESSAMRAVLRLFFSPTRPAQHPRKGPRHTPTHTNTHTHPCYGTYHALRSQAAASVPSNPAGCLPLLMPPSTAGGPGTVLGAAIKTMADALTPASGWPLADEGVTRVWCCLMTNARRTPAAGVLKLWGVGACFFVPGGDPVRREKGARATSTRCGQQSVQVQSRSR